MIRRWSRLENFKTNDYRPLILRFNSLKLLKAAYYRRFVTGVTKFKRIKLAKWKRHATWLQYVSIFKFWIKDYTIYKKIIKSQYVNTTSSFSFLVHDYLYIKKKNALAIRSDQFFLICNISKFLINYCFKKYNKNSIFFFLNVIENTNLNFSLFFDNDLNFGNTIQPLANISENSLIALDFIFRKIRFPNLSQDLIFFKIYNIYKFFILLILTVKLFCRSNVFN